MGNSSIFSVSCIHDSTGKKIHMEAHALEYLIVTPHHPFYHTFHPTVLPLRLYHRCSTFSYYRLTPLFFVDMAVGAPNPATTTDELLHSPNHHSIRFDSIRFLPPVVARRYECLFRPGCLLIHHRTRPISAPPSWCDRCLRLSYSFPLPFTQKNSHCIIFLHTTVSVKSPLSVAIALLSISHSSLFPA